MQFNMDSFIARARQLKPTTYMLIAVAVILLILPQITPTYYLFLSTEVLIFAIAAVALNLLVGYTGLISFGHAAFFGLGGYAVAVILTHTGIQNFGLVILLVVLITTGFSMAMGLIMVRTSGFYFLMITLALAQMVWGIIYGWYPVTGGSSGLFTYLPPNLGLPWNVGDFTAFYYLALAFFVVCIFMMYRITTSPYGHTLVGIREDEVRMEALGYNTWRYKYSIIVISGMFTGLAGALKAYQDNAITPSSASFVLSALLLLMILLGGRHVFIGPAVGAFVVWFLRQFLSSYTEYWASVLGVLFIALVMFASRGVVGSIVERWEVMRHRLRTRD